MLTATIALALRCLLVAQDPSPAIYPVDESSGPIEVRGSEGRTEQWMCTRLVDARTGAPLRGRISAYVEHEHPEPSTWPPLRQAASDAEGWVRLRIDDLLAERGPWLVAEAEGYAPSAEMTSFPQFPWELERGVDVPLRVLDALGRPIAGAHVGWILGCGHTADVRQAVTDADGRATLASVSSEEGEVWIVGRNVRGDYLDLCAWRPGRGELVLHCDAAPTHRGIVVDAAGRPRAGVHVGLAESHRGPWCLTDEAGRFVLEGTESTEVYVVDERTGEEHWFDLAPRGEETRFVLPEGGAERPEPVLPDEENVRLRVDLPAGSRGQSVQITAWCAALGFRANVWTEREEVLSVAWPAGTYELVFGGGAGDWCERRSTLEVPRGGSVELAVELKPRRRVRMWMDATSACARLLTEHGQLELVTPTWQRSIEDDVLQGRSIAVPESDPWAVRLRLFDRAQHVSGALVDGNGELEIPPLEPHRIRVRFADAQGRPVLGRARIAKHPRGHQEYEGEADWSERAEHIELLSWLGPGRWLLAVDSGDAAWRIPRPISEIELPPATKEILDLGTITMLPAHERGFVLRLPDGSPAVDVGLRWNDEQVRLDEEGRLPARHFAGPGDRVEVDLGDGITVPLVQELAGAGPWELGWPAGELELEVRDTSGALVPSFAVHMDGTTHVGEDGTLVRRGLATGSRELIIAAQGYLPQRLELNLAPRAEAALRLQPR